MKIGYVRVSKQEQNEALQMDALTEARCEKWFLDKITGSKAEWKGLNEALKYLRPGDTFVVFFAAIDTRIRRRKSGMPLQGNIS